MNTEPLLDRTRALIAALLALVLVMAGAVTAGPAFAAGPAVSVSEAPREGGVVTVTGSGFTATAPGIYLGVGPAGLPGFYAGASQIADVVWVAPGNPDGSSGERRTAPMADDGSFTVQVTVPAHTEGAQYAIYTSKAHGQGFADPSQNTVAPVAWQPAPAVATTTTLTVSPSGSAVAGADFTLGAVVEPAASGTVSYFAGTTPLGEAPTGATLTTRIATPGTAQLTAVFTPSDPAAFAGSTSAAVAYEITAPSSVPTPTVTVSKTADLDPAGETIVVRGTGFAPNPPATSGKRPPLAGKFGGAYVVFGVFPDVWKPSDGVSSKERTVLAQKWGVLEGDLQTIGGAAAGAIAITPDGLFETTLTVSAAEESALVAGNYGIYTYPGSGAAYAPFETYTPLAFADSEAGPAIAVTVTDASAAAGATLQVTGSGFGDTTGAYAAVIEKGTESAVTAGGGYVAFGYWAGAIVDGSLDKTLVAPTTGLDRSKQYEVIVWRTHSNPGADTIYARADVPLTAEHWASLFPGTDPTDPTDPAQPGTPTQPATPAAPRGAGSLKWAISSSFAGYVTGIAHGSIALSNGATRAGGVFQFGQAAGSTYDPATGTGTVSYTGAVRFTGHAGVLDVTVADPQVRIGSRGSATLLVSSGGRQVAFATLDLAAATRVTANGTVRYVNAPAALTAAGRDQVLAGFSTQLDPVTFTIGVPAAAPAGATGTVASAPRADSARTIPSTPPTDTGIELDASALAALEAGESVTVSAPGFAPNEEGIQVVVYSTPTLLGEVTADASGVAAWTGSLPAALADGEHTLTFQGSVDRGIRFTLARAATDGCVVDAATLRWGFKDSFRTYLEGLAGGGWELTEVAYEYPEFAWTGGTGAVDPETRSGLVALGGGIRFTGHDGALDTTLTNARVELAGDTGYLVFDVSGTTQSGEPVTAAGVRFAEFAVPDLEVTDGGLALDALPATLTEAGAAAFGTYAAGEALDPVTATLPLAAECELEPVAPAADDTVAQATTTDAVTPEPAAAPVWPWALGGLAVVLGIGAVVWIVVARRRRMAGGPDAG